MFKLHWVNEVLSKEMTLVNSQFGQIRLASPPWLAQSNATSLTKRQVKSRSTAKLTKQWRVAFHGCWDLRNWVDLFRILKSLWGATVAVGSSDLSRFMSSGPVDFKICNKVPGTQQHKVFWRWSPPEEFGTSCASMKHEMHCRRFLDFRRVCTEDRQWTQQYSNTYQP